MNNYLSAGATKNLFVALYSLLSRTLFNTDKVSDYLRPIAGLISNKYYNSQCSAKVISVQNITSKMYTITLKVSKSQFKDFKAGQFVTIEVEQNGRRLLRTFSISSAPSELTRHSTIQLSISKQENGKVTPWLCDNIVPGQYIHLSQALGEFTLQPNKNRTFIAAGSGITPIISMIKSLDISSLKLCTLLYYVSDKTQTPFFDELASLKQAGLNIDILETKQHGHFSINHLTKINKNFLSSDAYLCGPEAMVESCETQLKEAGIPSEKIFHELFGASSKATFDTDSTSKRTSEITITYEQAGYQSKVDPSNNASLLELAEKDQLKPLSGCRMGVCHQCVCEKTSGRVYNMKTGSISDSGQEEIQLCISKPIDSVTLKL
jgi:stearoyl-CoA 9-desaturase NADPH oxidoreductase